MFGFGSQELLIIGGIVMVLFGGSKLPQLGSALGKGLSNFKQGVKELDEDAASETEVSDADEKE